MRIVIQASGKAARTMLTDQFHHALDLSGILR